MSQNLVQNQRQETKQQLKLSHQHMLQIRMLEMPLAKLEDYVNAELIENWALDKDSNSYNADDEYKSVDDEYKSSDTEGEDYDDDEIDSFTEHEKDQALDDAYGTLGGDDVMKNLSCYDNIRNADYEEQTYGSKDSFYDTLKEQMNMLVLTEKEKEVMEYLIGSLDNDGLLRSNPDNIIDELAIYDNIYVTPEEMQHMIKLLQQFDPAGIGARDLRECLLLQIQRKEKNDITKLMYKIISDYYDDFMNKHWDKIRQQLNISEEKSEVLASELTKLNPKPGASLGETEGSKMQQVTPDFTIVTDDDGRVSFTVNNGMLPELFIPQEYKDLLEQYTQNKETLNKRQKENFVITKQNVERAQGFIEAVKQRRHTLFVTMKAIIDIQKKYFQDGDEAEIKPMILKDVADRTGLDISTISRVSNLKYAQTPWGIFKLRHFFSNGYVNEEGEELPTRKIKMALQELIDAEDKKHPLNDQAICKEMEKKGFAIARRTVAKYRKQLGIPVARLRKK